LPERALSPSVWVRFLDPAVGKLPDPRAVREQDVLLTVGELYGLYSVLLNALDRPVRKNALLLAVRKYALDSPVRKPKIMSQKCMELIITYTISLVPSGKCFSIWLFENLNTCSPSGNVVWVVFASAK